MAQEKNACGDVKNPSVRALACKFESEMCKDFDGMSTSSGSINQIQSNSISSARFSMVTPKNKTGLRPNLAPPPPPVKSRAVKPVPCPRNKPPPRNTSEPPVPPPKPCLSSSKSAECHQNKPVLPPKPNLAAVLRREEEASTSVSPNKPAEKRPQSYFNPPSIPEPETSIPNSGIKSDSSSLLAEVMKEVIEHRIKDPTYGYAAYDAKYGSRSEAQLNKQELHMILENDKILLDDAVYQCADPDSEITSFAGTSVQHNNHVPPDPVSTENTAPKLEPKPEPECVTETRNRNAEKETPDDNMSEGSSGLYEDIDADWRKMHEQLEKSEVGTRPSAAPPRPPPPPVPELVLSSASPGTHAASNTVVKRSSLATSMDTEPLLEQERCELGGKVSALSMCQSMAVYGTGDDDSDQYYDTLAPVRPPSTSCAPGRRPRRREKLQSQMQLNRDQMPEYDGRGAAPARRGLWRIKSDIQLNLAKQVGNIKLKFTSSVAAATALNSEPADNNLGHLTLPKSFAYKKRKRKMKTKSLAIVPGNTEPTSTCQTESPYSADLSSEPGAITLAPGAIVNAGASEGDVFDQGEQSELEWSDYDEWQLEDLRSDGESNHRTGASKVGTLPSSSGLPDVIPSAVDHLQKCEKIDDHVYAAGSSSTTEEPSSSGQDSANAAPWPQSSDNSNYALADEQPEVTKIEPVHRCVTPPPSAENLDQCQNAPEIFNTTMSPHSRLVLEQPLYQHLILQQINQFEQAAMSTPEGEDLPDFQGDQQLGAPPIQTRAPETRASTRTNTNTSFATTSSGIGTLPSQGGASSTGPLGGGVFSTPESVLEARKCDAVDTSGRLTRTNTSTTSGTTNSKQTASSAHSNEHARETYRQKFVAPSTLGSQRSLWCEVACSDILNSMTMQERKLQEAIFEVLTSEASYLRSLNVLITHFMAARPFSGNYAMGSVIDKRERKNLFSNILAVRDASERLLTELECKFTESTIMDERICDILTAHTEKHFHVYVTYCSNQIYQDRTLKKLKRENSAFSSALQQLEQDRTCASLDMRSFLTLPTQRITRYPLLVIAVLERCQKLLDGVIDCDRNLPLDVEKLHRSAQIALQQTNAIVSRCNEGARQMESTEQLINIDSRLVYKQGVRRLALVSQSRHLVKQGELLCLPNPGHLTPASQNSSTASNSNSQSIIGVLPNNVTSVGSRKSSVMSLSAYTNKSGVCKRLHLFLCTDWLLVTKVKSSSQQLIVKNYCARVYVAAQPTEPNSAPFFIGDLSALPPNKSAHLFVVTLMRDAQSKQTELILCAESETDRQRWLHALMPNEELGPIGERVYASWDCPRARAVYNYDARQPDELQLCAGDLVDVRRRMPDGWCHGERLRDGQRGWFPASYTVEISNDHTRARNYRERLKLIRAAEVIQSQHSFHLHQQHSSATSSPQHAATNLCASGEPDSDKIDAKSTNGKMRSKSIAGAGVGGGKFATLGRLSRGSNKQFLSVDFDAEEGEGKNRQKRLKDRLRRLSNPMAGLF